MPTRNASGWYCDLLGIDFEEALGLFDEERNVHERLIADVDPSDPIVSIEKNSCVECVVLEVVEGTERFEGDEVRVAQEVKLIRGLQMGKLRAHLKCLLRELRTDGLHSDTLIREGIEVFGEGIELVNAMGAFGAKIENEQLWFARRDTADEWFAVEVSGYPFWGGRRRPVDGAKAVEFRACAKIRALGRGTMPRLGAELGCEDLKGFGGG